MIWSQLRRSIQFWWKINSMSYLNILQWTACPVRFCKADLHSYRIFCINRDILTICGWRWPISLVNILCHPVMIRPAVPALFEGSGPSSVAAVWWQWCGGWSGTGCVTLCSFLGCEPANSVMTPLYTQLIAQLLLSHRYCSSQWGSCLTLTHQNTVITLVTSFSFSHVVILIFN